MKHIAIIDDDKTSLLLVEAVLKSLGYKVTAYMDAKTALVRLKELKPDVIISDINMPEIDGNDFALLFKDSPDNPKTPIIALTADKPKDNFVSLFDAVLQKPVTPGPLDETIKSVLY